MVRRALLRCSEWLAGCFEVVSKVLSVVLRHATVCLLGSGWLLCGDYDVLTVFLACCYMVASVFWVIGRVFRGGL